MSSQIIKSELAKLYNAAQSSEETEKQLATQLTSAELAEFIVMAFNRGWITNWNLGLDDAGQDL